MGKSSKTFFSEIDTYPLYGVSEALYMIKTDFDKYYKSCALCPRGCHADRTVGAKGVCGESNALRAARAALHFGEEPCISGKNGSGAVFFSGCSLNCVFCQNYGISHENYGKEITVERLTDIFTELQSAGANNINLVSPSHFAPHIAAALSAANLKIPVVYNCSGYESPETLKMLDGLIDIYLPDLKYFSPEVSKKYSSAADYFSVASRALKIMYSQVGRVRVGDGGIMRRGLLIRHLVLPSQRHDSINLMQWISDNFVLENILVSLMSQYTPMPHCSDYLQRVAVHPKHLP